MNVIQRAVLIVGGVCVLIILGYSMAVRPWFDSGGWPLVQWTVAAGAAVGIVTLVFMLFGRTVLIVAMLFPLLMTVAGFADLYRAWVDRAEPSEPVILSLMELEDGRVPEVRHVSLEGGVLELRNVAFRKMKDQGGSAVVDRNYYPLLSADRFESAYRAAECPERFSVLVEERGFGASVDRLPGDARTVEAISGMLRRQTATSLDSSIRAHFEARSFPGIDWSRVYVLRLDAKPFGSRNADRYSSAKGYLGFGIPTLGALALLLWVARTGRSDTTLPVAEKQLETVGTPGQ